MKGSLKLASLPCSFSSRRLKLSLTTTQPEHSLVFDLESVISLFIIMRYGRMRKSISDNVSIARDSRGRNDIAMSNEHVSIA
jgi:hypothetical protein